MLNTAAAAAAAAAAGEEVSKNQAKAEEVGSGRERLKRHRMEMAGQVWIPEIWGQESFLKYWADCSAFDSLLAPKGVASARRALVEDCRRANSARGAEDREPALRDIFTHY